MIQLYREREYLQIWERNDLVVTYRGTVGRRGTITEILAKPPERGAEIVEREAALAILKGFAPLAAIGRSKLIVHYRFYGWPEDEVASFVGVVKELIGDALGWTGNGAYDGYSVGNQTIALWYFVVDLEPALDAVIESLRSHGYLQDAETEASIAVDRGGALAFLYPPERLGERFI